MILFKAKLDYSKPFSANTDLAYSVISSAVSIVSALFATSSHSALETERGQLDVHKQQIKDFVDNKLRTYYGVEEGKPITLSAVLGDAITSYDASLKAQIAEAVKASTFFAHKKSLG